jgi:N-terminal acetyltransferase B complex non-catalytic subunit
MRPILYKIAHRLLTSSPTPSYASADRFYLHLLVLKELELWDDVDKLLQEDIAKAICATNLYCNEIRRDIWKTRGLLKEEGEAAEKLIVEKQ